MRSAKGASEGCGGGKVRRRDGACVFKGKCDGR